MFRVAVPDERHWGRCLGSRRGFGYRQSDRHLVAVGGTERAIRRSRQGVARSATVLWDAELRQREYPLWEAPPFTRVRADPI